MARCPTPAEPRTLDVESVFIDARSLNDSILQAAADLEVFRMARVPSNAVMTKDFDFVQLSKQFGPPPQIIWLRCGNTSYRFLRQFLETKFPDASLRVLAGDPIVELSSF